VAITFRIGRAGDVEESEIQRSTIPDDRVGRCIADAVRRWKFPAPDGGVVYVTYPFQFTPAGNP
jgi:TonB family protein